jgi:hypothetical protein
MNRCLLILTSAAVATATATASPNINRLSATDREKLVLTATRELSRRHLPLPKQYRVDIGEGTIGNELEPNREIWTVHFRLMYRGKEQSVYKIFIDKRSGKIDYVFDTRKMIPSSI